LNRSDPRRTRSFLSQFTMNQLHLRSALITATWSFFTPGLGNLLQDRKIKGLILIIWGIVINTYAKINMAIWYSLTGQFELAKKVVDTRWLLLYVAVYVYSAWDSYRGTVELNKLYLLADREDGPIQPFILKALDINALEKRSPALAAGWSIWAPGLGSLYLHKSLEGIFFIAWSIVVMYYSHCLQAIHYTLTGEFQLAKNIVNLQWLLFLPPIYVFQIYDSYASAVECNKLFEKEQSQWLREHYQRVDFEMPI
jgi:hypothetical protein